VQAVLKTQGLAGETMFGLPPLNDRDAKVDDMSAFITSESLSEEQGQLFK